jgi:hypothetical protein
MNTWQFVDGDIVLTSEDQEQLALANQWIAGLVQAVRQQVMEEIQNGRTIISDNQSSTAEQLELPEVPC